MKLSKPDGKFGKPVQVKEGEAHKYPLRADGSAVAYTICCDCGLTHLEEFVPRKHYLRVRVWRDDDRTAEQRGGKKLQLVSKKRAK